MTEKKHPHNATFKLSRQCVLSRARTLLRTIHTTGKYHYTNTAKRRRIRISKKIRWHSRYFLSNRLNRSLHIHRPTTTTPSSMPAVDTRCPRTYTATGKYPPPLPPVSKTRRRRTFLTTTSIRWRTTRRKKRKRKLKSNSSVGHIPRTESTYQPEKKNEFSRKLKDAKKMIRHLELSETMLCEYEKSVGTIAHFTMDDWYKAGIFTTEI